QQLDAVIRGTSELRTYLTGSGGVIVPGAAVTLPRGASAFTLRDMNGDGALDLVALLTSPGAIKVYLQQSGGTFLGMTERSTATSNPLGIAAGLLDANANADAVVGEVGKLSSFVGLGNGTFQSTYYTASASQPVKIVLADVTGDARPDAIVE